MTIELLHKGRFHVLNGATAKALASNAWAVSIPIDELSKLLRTAITLSSLDDAILVVDDIETSNTIGHQKGKSRLTVTTWAI